MLLYHFILALRSILRNKVPFFINIFGLSIGLASCIIITMYVNYELSHDGFHVNKDRIHRVIYESFRRGEISQFIPWTPAALSKDLRDEFPQIESTCRTMDGSPLVSYKNTDISLNKFSYVDSAFFKMFSIELLKGNAEDVLNKPFSIVLSETFAQKLFGEVEPLGKFIELEKNHPYLVTGIMEDLNKNSQFEYDAVASFTTLLKTKGDSVMVNRSNWNYQTFFMLRNASDIDQVQAGLMPLHKKIYGEDVDEEFEPHTEQLEDIYLESKVVGDFFRHGNKTMILVFAIVALLILGIACINYFNLFLAQGKKKQKEFAIRKTLGGSSGNILKQSFIESLVILFLSLGIAFSIVELSLSPISEALNVKLSPTQIFSLENVMAIVVIFSFALLITGILPSYLLSKQKILTVLKGSLQSNRSIIFRKSLLIFQFAVALVLIASTLVIYAQLQYLESKDMGFTGEGVIILNANDKLVENYTSFKTAVSSVTGVESASFSNQIPGRGGSTQGFKVEKNGQEEDYGMRSICTDHDFIKTLGIKIIEGRDFDRTLSSDSFGAYIINQRAQEFLDLQNTVGNPFRVWWSAKPGKIIGVIEDFHLTSPRAEVEPLVIYLRPSWAQFLSIKIDGRHSQTLDEIETIWKEEAGGFPFDYAYLNEDFKRVFTSEKRLMSLFGYFSLLTILIACLGLLGLISFVIEWKTKEIGVRKVLGSNSNAILTLLTGEYLRLIAISLLLSVPTTYFLMNQWLDTFVSHVAFPYWTFFVAIIFIIAIAILTVGYHSIKASNMNPISALRYE